MLRVSLSAMMLVATIQAAQPPVPQFFARTDLYSLGESIAVGDVNNDGILDVVTSDDGEVFLGNGDGTFGPGIISRTVAGTRLALADLNGDGNLDFISSSNALTLTVGFGNGDGTFQPQTAYPLPGQANPYGIVIEDFNRDGLLDVVVTSTEGLLIYLNQGGGILAYDATYFTGQKVTAAISADIDGDGKPDLAVGVNRGVTFLLGTGSGSFQVGQSFPLSYNAGSIVFGDVNNDGIPDMLTGGNFYTNFVYEAFLFLGTGGGEFGARKSIPLPAGATQIAAADVNGDGVADLIVIQDLPDALTVMLNRGNGTFYPAIDYSVCGGINGFALAPLRKPGLIDVVAVGAPSYQASVLLNNGNGLYMDGLRISMPAQPGPLVAADFNGDGLDDLAVTTASNVQVYLNTGKLTGLFTAGSSVALSASSLIEGDFNGDGIPDLAMVISENQIAVVFGHGDGTFSAPIITPSAGTSNGFTVKIFAGDFNGDGKLDLVTTFNGLLFGNGDGTFQSPRPFVSAKMLTNLYLISTIVPVDLNRDGQMDLAVLGSSGGAGMYGLINNGKGEFFVSGPAPGSGAVDIPFQAAAGDFNGDGIPDNVETEEGELMVFFGVGNGMFSATPYHSPPANPLETFGVVGNDVNLDGKEDIVVTGGFPQSDMIVFTNNGDGTFQLPLYFGTAPNSTYIVKGHFNKFRAGRHDMAVSAYDGVDILLNSTK